MDVAVHQECLLKMGIFCYYLIMDAKIITITTIIAKTLGVFWIIDGLLQLQPKMFGPDFINTVLAPNLSGQPAFLHALITFGIHLFSLNIPLANTAAVAIQLLIGILLLFPPSGKTFKTGLYLSIIWGLVVWVFGEGMGNLLTGTASFYTGAPGSVLVYVLLSILLLKPEKISVRGLAIMAGIVLVFGALLQLQPLYWTSGGVSSLPQMAASDTVHAINNLPNHASSLWARNPISANILLLAIPLALGLLLIFKPSRWTAILTAIFLLLVWWLGQDFGSISTLFFGTVTDPNTAPIFAIFLIPFFLPVSRHQIINDNYQPI